MIGRAHHVLGHLERERIDVLEERLDVFLGVFADADAGGRGVGDDAVVHVGDIHHLQHLEAARMQESAQDVLEHEGAEISDVREGVDRGAAGVHADLAGMKRHERFLAAAERVLKDDVAHVMFPRAYRGGNGLGLGILADVGRRQANEQPAVRTILRRLVLYTLYTPGGHAMVPL